MLELASLDDVESSFDGVVLMVAVLEGGGVEATVLEGEGVEVSDLPSAAVFVEAEAFEF